MLTGMKQSSLELNLSTRKTRKQELLAQMDRVVPWAALVELIGVIPMKRTSSIRGLLSELGIVLPLKAAVVRRDAIARLEDLPGWANTVIGDLLSEVSRLDERIGQYDQHMRTMARQSTEAQRLMQLSGIGETTATALLSTIGNGRDFKCGRQLCAWLGLVPGQYSSGGKQRLGRITKAGDPYLRSLLVLGARAVLAAAKNKSDPISRWANALAQRRGYWKAVVAIAAKNARMCWAVLSRGEDFRLPA